MNNIEKISGFINKKAEMKTITQKELDTEWKGHVINIQKNKGIVCIDGFRYFKLKK